MESLRRIKPNFLTWALLVVLVLQLSICGRVFGSGSCPFSTEDSADEHGHHHDHEHDHHHIHGGHIHGDGVGIEFMGHGEEGHPHHGCGHSDDHDHHHHHHHHHHDNEKKFRLPEELEEEEDLRLYGFGSHHHHDHDEHEHGHEELSTAGLWLRAMGSSLLVSMASLVCLMILPLIISQGKPSKTVVDLLAAFGAGAMVGDAFLHQLPHALGGSHNHSHSHSLDNGHDHTHHHNHNQAVLDSHTHSHSHSLEELSVGLAALAGIILFFLVEKIVRYVEELSAQGVQGFHYGHHHHHQSKVCSKKDDDHHNSDNAALDGTESSESEKANEAKSLDKNTDTDTDSDAAEKKDSKLDTTLRKRTKSNGANKPGKELPNSINEPSEVLETSEVKPMPNSTSNLVVGYLNLFSDGVHNFTDGMALGSAFLLYGSVGGWSRTLFLLAHELPQEIGDFGILVRSGFSVFKALLFNFLSALVALAGTALALLMGKDPGHSAWIEGFTAGGFIYIAMVGVLPEMHQKGISFRSTLLQLLSLMSGMGVALCISLFE